MGKGFFNLPWINEGARMQASFIFGDNISEFEKRYRTVLSGNISLHGQMFGFEKSKGKLMVCFVLNMCELMKGAQYCEFFYSLQNLYVSITQTLYNIKLRCNHGLQTFRTIRQKKKRWNSTNSICFLQMYNQIFFSVLQKKKNDLPEGFQMIHVNGRRHYFFRKPCQFSWQTLEVLLAHCHQSKKS